jgi:hypothetical protein
MEAIDADEKMMIASAHFRILISTLQCHPSGKMCLREIKKNK